MTNEQYLIVSYFSVAAGAVVLALVTWLAFRGPLRRLTEETRSGGLRRFLRRAFPVVLVLMVLSGFCSVSFYSCDVTTYKQVIANRSYLEHKNYEQVSAVLNWLVVALFLWGFVLAIFLIVLERERGLREMEARKSGSGQSV